MSRIQYSNAKIKTPQLEFVTLPPEEKRMLARQNTTAHAETFSAEEEAWIYEGMSEAEVRLQKVREAVVKAMPDIKQNVMLIDMVSRSTGSDSMPGNVTLQIDTAVRLLTALKAAVEGHD